MKAQVNFDSLGGSGSVDMEDITSHFSGVSHTITEAEEGIIIFFCAVSSNPNVTLNGSPLSQIMNTGAGVNYMANVKKNDVITWSGFSAIAIYRIGIV